MSSADFTDSATAEKRLRAAANKLHKLVPEVAHARQVIEFASDRRKNLLAEYVAPLLAAGMGVAAAEHTARADPEYQARFEEQATQLRDAYAVVKLWEATQATYDAARSLLSMSKELIRNLQE